MVGRHLKPISKKMILLTETFAGKTKGEARGILGEFYNKVHKSNHRFTGADIHWNLALVNYPNFGRALDVGCGNGEVIAELREKKHSVWGIDIARSLKDVWKKKEIEQYCKIASARKIPFEDNYFDFVVCFNTLEHIPEWDIAESIKEIARVGSDKFFFVIATSQELRPTKGYDAHICVKSLDWWTGKIGRYIRISRGTSHENPLVGCGVCDAQGIPRVKPKIPFSYCDIWGVGKSDTNNI